MSNLQITNSLSRKKEVFKPINPKKISLYACGPTVYDNPHVGNARSLVVFDVLFRVLRSLYDNNVTYVRNITDVDDKIIDASKKQKKKINEITEEITKIFHENCKSLNCLEPSVEPKATNHIKEMVEMTSSLISKGFAYENKGNVYFNIKSFKDYGKLSNKNLDEFKAGYRIEISDLKKNLMDFVLWKPSVDEDPGWESPWGRGRPGWHLECSVMSEKFLGKKFDIHGGGLDLIFPHHENEIAQSRCNNNTSSFANYWIHVAPLNVDGKKMSKSLGNYLTIRDLLNDYHPEVLKTFFLLTHYRKPINFTASSINEAKNILDKLYESLKDAKKFDSSKVDRKKIESFKEALEDDFNTSKALKILQKISQDLNSTRENKGAKEILSNTLKVLGNIIGIFNDASQDYFQYGLDQKISNKDIEIMIAERNQARLNKDFKKADLIREKLFSLNIILEDDGDKTIWKKLV